MELGAKLRDGGQELASTWLYSSNRFQMLSNEQCLERQPLDRRTDPPHCGKKLPGGLLGPWSKANIASYKVHGARPAQGLL